MVVLQFFFNYKDRGFFASKLIVLVKKVAYSISLLISRLIVAWLTFRVFTT